MSGKSYEDMVKVLVFCIVCDIWGKWGICFEFVL